MKTHVACGVLIFGISLPQPPSTRRLILKAHGVES
jgi:hypothetical protein